MDYPYMHNTQIFTRRKKRRSAPVRIYANNNFLLQPSKSLFKSPSRLKNCQESLKSDSSSKSSLKRTFQPFEKSAIYMMAFSTNAKKYYLLSVVILVTVTKFCVTKHAQHRQKGLTSNLCSAPLFFGRPGDLAQLKSEVVYDERCSFFLVVNPLLCASVVAKCSQIV